MSTPLNVKHISESFVRPKFEDTNSNHSLQPIYLSPWELAMLSIPYMRNGLLFAKPPPPDYEVAAVLEGGQVRNKEPSTNLVERLKMSLSLALVHFYPLAGQLVTAVDDQDPNNACFIFIDCQKGPGAKLAHAALDVTVDDVLSPTSNVVPQFVRSSLFDNEATSSYGGHTNPLLSIQVTDLIDGIFIGFSMNHAVADGTSLWHFINTWSEITANHENNNMTEISRPPIHERWFPNGNCPIIRLPCICPDQFLHKHPAAPLLVAKVFHFSSDSLAKLKTEANSECGSNNISTFLAMGALVWKSITRARSLPRDHKTVCRVIIDIRRRLNPPLSQDYFGNIIKGSFADTKAGDLFTLSVGSAAALLKQALDDYTDKIIRDWLTAYINSPVFHSNAMIPSSSVPGNVILTSSPRFNMYGNKFGLGKPLAVRSGCKRDGVVVFQPGYEGGGSVDLQIFLELESMTALESDQDFMEFVS